jgi:hypothetical protein
MVDDPCAAVRAAARSVALGGTLHVVDFGDMAGLPSWFRKGMTAWLARFHVRHRPEIEETIKMLTSERRSTTERTSLAGGYALLLRLRQLAQVEPEGLEQLRDRDASLVENSPHVPTTTPSRGGTTRTRRPWELERARIRKLARRRT